MQCRDVEEYLSGFKLKDPGSDLGRRAVLRATAAWRDSHANRVRVLKALRRYAYALALLVLLSTSSSKVDSVLTARLIGSRPMPVQQAGRDLDMKDLYSDLGLYGERYELSRGLVRAERYKRPLSDMFDHQRQLIEELSSMNGGLS